MNNKSLPKLGRPFVAGSKRVKYLKFYLSDSEIEDFEFLEKHVKKFYEENGYVYNRSNHFRLILKNCSNEKILKQLFKNPTEEIKNSNLNQI